MALRLRIERRRPPLPRFFSSSSPDDKDKDKDKDKDPQPSSISSHFGDVKATLKHQHLEGHPLRRPTPRSSFLSRPQRQQPSPEYIEELQKRLSEFRPHVVPPPPPSPPSFQKAYQRNDLANNGNTDSPRNSAKTWLDGIKESLSGISNRGNARAPGRDGLGTSGGDHMSLSRFTETLRLRPEETDKAASRKSSAGEGGKGEALPLRIFGKEIKEKKEAKAGKQKDSLEKTKFVKSYEYEELGMKLRMLRNPADEGMKGFSLEELNERLVRLKEMEEKETASRSKETYWSGLRETLLNIKISEDEEKKNNTSKWAY